MISEEDLRIDLCRNSAEASVRITHLPTGLTGFGMDKEGGSSVVARDLALLALVPKLREAGVEFPRTEPATSTPVNTFDALVKHLQEGEGN